VLDVDLSIGARDARHRQQLREEGDSPVRIYRVECALLTVVEVGHAVDASRSRLVLLFEG
jgi:hypothetical protein